MQKLTRYEKARLIGARALQISLGAPILVDVSDQCYDPIEIALKELENDAIPMQIIRKMPEKWNE